METVEPPNLLKLEPFPEERYDPLSLAALTAYSLYWLSQWGLQTTIENVAVLNFKLFPSKFAMVGWPQFPDINRTNRSVLQMRPKYRNLATSITDKGILLNERGIDEAEALLVRLGSPKFQDGSTPPLQFPISRSRGTGRPSTIHPEDQVAHVKQSKLFQMYEAGQWENTEPIDLVNFLGVYDHTPSEEKRRRMHQFQLAAKQTGDEAVQKFLDLVSVKFHGYLHRKPERRRL